jgi:hypothetical protein
MHLASIHRLVFVVGALAGCNALTGVDDYQFGSGGAATTTTSTGGAGGTGGASGGGGSGAGGSGTGGSGTGGACGGCDANELCCGVSTPTCRDVSIDPNRCGSCTNQCASTEWCEGAMCKCRPGLVGSAGNCVDPLADPAACGGGAACDGATPLCQNGACVSACAGNLTECSGGCFDISKSALHCGSCTQKCNNDEVCIGGNCFEYAPAFGCAACPCAACAGDFDKCCNYPGTTTATCVNHDAPGCP